MAEKYPIEFGDYRLLRKIAQGGMAEIFLAHDKKGEICALKRILPHLAHQEGFIRMFIDEARIVTHLDHDNVAGVIAQGKHEGFYFIAMEYVEGHSILALQDRARKQKMALPHGLLAWIVAELLAGLGSAHAARDAKGRHLQIVHRDVTPQNALISYDGTVKLIDFGVAKARARLTQTEAGFTKGKLSYMSPEQARGEELDGRSDLFSIGIILYEITTGKRLFNKDGPGGILSAIVNDPITPPSLKDRKYPRDLEAILMRALEKDVSRRWQTAEDMRDALLRFARRERPRPGKTRLAALVHDLFGDPEHQSLIASAQAVAEPTPASVKAASVIEGESVRVHGTKIPRANTDGDGEHHEPKPDETRMFSMPAQASPPKSAVEAAVEIARELTSDGTPIIDIPLEHDDIAVPEPRRPARVRFAQALTTWGADFRTSIEQHKLRYAAFSVTVMLGLTLAVGYSTGVTSDVSEALSGAADEARRMKQSAGLGEVGSTDAGVTPTILELLSRPPGARIVIDGVGAGCSTPCKLQSQLEPGKRMTIELTLNGFRPRSEVVTVQDNEGMRTLEVDLERQVGALRIESKPPGAIVMKDGKRLKVPTPVTLEGVRADQPVTLLVKKRGYRSKSRVVVVRDGERKVESFSLAIDPRSIKPGTLDVRTAPSSCEISIDGQAVGRSPLLGHSLGSGTYSVTARCDNYSDGFEVVNIASGQSKKIRIDLDPNVFGYLTIRVKPPRGSKVGIDGRMFQPPVLFQKVVPGRHRVKAFNKGLNKTKTMSVDVAPNQKVSREINLLN